MCGKQGYHKDEATVPPISHQNTRYCACSKATIQGFLVSIGPRRLCNSLRPHRGSIRDMVTDENPSMPPSRNLAEVVPGCFSGSNLPPSSPRSTVLRYLSHQNHAEAAYDVIGVDTHKGVPRPGPY